MAIPREASFRCSARTADRVRRSRLRWRRSFGTQRLATKLSGDNGDLNYVVNAASFRTDGYRDHSAQDATT